MEGSNLLDFIHTMSTLATVVTVATSPSGFAASNATPILSGDFNWSIVGSPALLDSSLTTGCSWGDYDGDGDSDIFFANGNDGGASAWDRLIRNDEDGSFSLQTTVLESPGPERFGVWGDYDNDDDLDLLVTSWGPERLYRNDGSGEFVDVSTPIFSNTSETYAASWVDIDNDGDLDISLGHRDQPPQFLRNDGSLGFADATPPAASSLDPSFVYSTAWSDIDGDRDQDVYIVRNSVTNRLLRNEGKFKFTDITAPPLNSIGAGHGAVWGDADGDGRFDLYVTNLGDGNRLFRNLGGGAFSDESHGEPASSGYSAGCAWGDYDNDGRLDLYFTNAYAVNKLLHNDGGLAFTNASEGVLLQPGGGGGTSFCDFDQDGDLDILLANLNEAQSNRLFRNDRPLVSEWLEVSLVGTESNRNGIGARVGVWGNGLEQWREISAGSGFCSEGPLSAHFGLGLASLRGRGVVDSVVVQWPSGIDQVVRDIPPNRMITVVETDVATGVADPLAPEPPGHDGMGIVSVRPNPFRDAASVFFRLSRPGGARLDIFDVHGRRVRHWEESQFPAGESVVEWNGAGESGRRLAAGVYWVRLEGAGWTDSRKVVLVD